MDAERPRRSRDEAWADLLDAYRPPHESAWDEALWPLLKAAASDSLFRSMYPWLSMHQLYASKFDDMRDRHEPFPTIAAGGDVYSVIAYPLLSGHVLFETNDPAEAVAVAARLMRDVLAGRSAESEGDHSDVPHPYPINRRGEGSRGESR
ncbi:DUF6193 family natural product biosynthesis protein [Streptomyces sp. NPDC002133]|uniref:DUF6193 family natural product biosynthesis protein n=1 Tax=Streptomyces sp. NPDC002133 TaxID=3154409 RepID=UPI00332B9BB4